MDWMYEMKSNIIQESLRCLLYFKEREEGLMFMNHEVRKVYKDTDLDIEAYQFKGIMQRFPAHFHDYYVIGFIEEGQRHLTCQREEFIINPGDLKENLMEVPSLS